MSKGMLAAAGGLSAADREKLIPENIREGVTLFEGTQREVAGAVIPPEDLVVLAMVEYYQPGYGDLVVAVRNNQGTYGPVSMKDVRTATLVGNVQKVVITKLQSGSVCGHTAPGVYDSGHTSNQVYIPGNYAAAFVVLGTL